MEVEKIYRYQTLAQDLESRLLQGEWKEGSRLPSIRQLAESYQCSKSTVIRAYEELERKHLIYVIPQSGYFVVKRSQETQTGDRWLDFSSSVPDPMLFPYQDFQHCLNQAIDHYQQALFTYGTPKGLSSLIQILQKQLTDHRIFANLDRFFITSGVQQALTFLVQMPFPQGKEMILIEQPSYHLLIKLLQLLQKPVLGIQRTTDGLDLDQVETIFRTKPIKFFYLLPRFHNPMGTTLSMEQKKALADLAKRYQVYLVEDDYLADLEVGSKNDPIYSFQQDFVIYLKSYSKIIFPGLRVGAAILPDELQLMFQQYKATYDIDSSMLAQAGLEIYIRNGMFQYHREKMRIAYASRMKRLYEVLKSLNMDDFITFPDVQAGVHTHLLLKEPISIDRLAQRLHKKKIKIGKTARNYLSSYPQQHMIQISVSNVTEKEVEEGIITICEEIKRLSRLYRRQFF